MSTLDLLVPCALVAILIWSASLNLVGPDFVVAEFAKWNYPPWFRYLVGAGELASAAMLAMPAFRVYGAGLLTLILLGVLFSFARSREWLRMEFPLLLIVLCVGLML